MKNSFQTLKNSWKKRRKERRKFSGEKKVGLCFVCYRRKSHTLGGKNVFKTNTFMTVAKQVMVDSRHAIPLFLKIMLSTFWAIVMHILSKKYIGLRRIFMKPHKTALWVKRGNKERQIRERSWVIKVQIPIILKASHEKWLISNNPCLLDRYFKSLLNWVLCVLTCWTSLRA